MTDTLKTIIQTHHLTVKTRSSNQTIVDNCNIHMSEGEITTIIGPNGAGKTSLLNAIIGDIKYQGTVDFPHFSSAPIERARQIAVLPQQSLLSFPFSVRDVVLLGRVPHATGHTTDNDIVNQALELLDIHDLAERVYTQLSGGEKQRVQLARVLSQIWRAKDATNNARLLVLDEPTTGLDIKHQHDLMRAVRLFANQGVSVLMVLHDINLAMRYSDKLVAMLSSQVIAHGKTAEVINQELVEKLFGLKVKIVNLPNSNTSMVAAV